MKPFWLCTLVSLLLGGVSYAADDWIMNIQRENKYEGIKFTMKSDGKELCRWEPTNIGVYIIDYHGVHLKGFDHELMVTRWTHGAHSSHIRIFDPLKKEKCLLYTASSEWDVDYEVNGFEIVIKVSLEKSVNDPSPVEKIIHWRPTL